MSCRPAWCVRLTSAPWLSARPHVLCLSRSLRLSQDEDAAEIERLYKNVKLTSKTFAAELEEDKEASERFLATLSAPKTKEDATLAAAQKALSATHAQLVKLKHKFCGAS